MSRYLFTTLPSNDLGLLTQSLPIACELRNRGHQAASCSPAKLISKAATPGRQARKSSSEQLGDWFWNK